MKTYALLIAMLLTSVAFGDELILKDGKSIKWTTLKDLGDTYEVETSDGVKLEVKKEDVLRFEKKTRAAEPKAGPALTGASFTFEKGKKLTQYDLLRAIDPKADVIRGNWKLAAGVLLADGGPLSGGRAQLETSYTPPAEYDLTLTIERTEGTREFTVGLMSPDGKQFCYEFANNGWNGVWLNGRPFEISGCTVKEDVLPKGKKRVIQFMVRKFGIAVKVDGKDFTTFKDDWSKLLTPGGEHEAAKKNVIYFLAKCTTTFKISQAIVTFPKE